jgi:hypothetical protein
MNLEQKRSNVVIHDRPVGQSGSYCASRAGHPVQECQFLGKDDTSTGNVPLDSSIQFEC